MKIRSKVVLSIIVILLIGTVLIGSVLIFQTKERNSAEIENFRIQERDRLEKQLKSAIDIVYGIIQIEYQKAGEASNSQELLSKLSEVRFDNNEGYLWITDNTLPYPTMLMHSRNPEYSGSVLNEQHHSQVLGKQKNLYQEIAELSNQNDEAQVAYLDEDGERLTYSRLFAPLGWIITGSLASSDIELNVGKRSDELNSELSTIYIILFTSVLFIVISAFFVNYIVDKFLKIIGLVEKRLKELAKGKAVEQLKLNRADEIGELTKSLDNYIEGISSYVNFAREIGNKNLDFAFQPLSEEDVLGNELIKMRDNLKLSEEQDKERNWFNEGMARFGEILRDGNKSLDELCDAIILNYVKYLDANQGCIFLLEEEEEQKFLKLMSTYAFNRRKFIEKRLELNQGLAGQCALEKATIHLKEVPDSYVSIRSGLGDAAPRAVLVTPLTVNDEIYGVIEIATFKKFTAYQIEFAEKLAESIASVISSVKVNERTKVLLVESQQRTEEMRAQEEEMRQNMEELEATQESMRRKEVELSAKVEEIKNNEIIKHLEEIATGIESSIRDAKRELNFLTQIPPIRGIVRAIENDGFDEIGNTSYEVWVDRLEQIFFGLMESKKIYHSIGFFNSQGECIICNTYNGGRVTASRDKEEKIQKFDGFKDVLKIDSSETLVRDFSWTKEHGLILALSQTVYFDGKKIGVVILNAYGENIVELIRNKENSNNSFHLMSSDNTKIYANGNGKGEYSELKKSLLIEPENNFSITISHLSIN
ncbi:cache domain-containing protein [Fulvivirgaceae bacterium BMA10]|uniref:Cache domain-containing protein n=1 Tax=Splendidivirga corallicola TaxID=3051826 RepID=A0ABT8KSZ9_9BACT|nr:cache domain-containing protein [Fulvivirgaceae bacterium BMA10]